MDVEKPLQIPLICNGHTRPVVFLAFSDLVNYDTSYFLISACKDGKPMLREGETGDWYGTFEGHKGAVWGCAMSPDALRAATGAADFCAKVWNAVTGEELLTLEHGHIVKSVNFSPLQESTFFVTGSNDKQIRLYDLYKPEAEPFKFVGHTDSVRHALLYDYDRKVMSCGEDRTVRLWDRRTHKEIQKITFSTNPSSLELQRDESIVTITHGKSVSFWTVGSQNGFIKLKELQSETKIHSASLHPDKSMFVCAGDDFHVYKHDYVTGEQLECYKGHFGPVHCIRFSPDGELYASGSEDGTLRLWQTNPGKAYGLWKVTDESEKNGSVSGLMKNLKIDGEGSGKDHSKKVNRSSEPSDVDRIVKLSRKPYDEYFPREFRFQDKDIKALPDIDNNSNLDTDPFISKEAKEIVQQQQSLNGLDTAIQNGFTDNHKEYTDRLLTCDNTDYSEINNYPQNFNNLTTGRTVTDPDYYGNYRSSPVTNTNGSNANGFGINNNNYVNNGNYNNRNYGNNYYYDRNYSTNDFLDGYTTTNLNNYQNFSAM